MRALGQRSDGAPLSALGPEAIQAAGAAAAPPLPVTKAPSALEGTPQAFGAGLLDVVRSVPLMQRSVARLGQGLVDAALGEAAATAARKLADLAPDRQLWGAFDKHLLAPAQASLEDAPAMRRDSREAPALEKLAEPGWALRQGTRQVPQLLTSVGGAASKGATVAQKLLAPFLMEGAETARGLEEKERQTGKKIGDVRFGTAVAGKGLGGAALELAGAEAILGKLAKYAPESVKKKLGGNVVEFLTGNVGEGFTERGQNFLGNFAELMATEKPTFRELVAGAQTAEFWEGLDKGGGESQILGHLVGTGASAARLGQERVGVRQRAARMEARKEWRGEEAPWSLDAEDGGQPLPDDLAARRTAWQEQRRGAPAAPAPQGADEGLARVKAQGQGLDAQLRSLQSEAGIDTLPPPARKPYQGTPAEELTQLRQESRSLDDRLAALARGEVPAGRPGYQPTPDEQLQELEQQARGLSDRLAALRAGKTPAWQNPLERDPLPKDAPPLETLQTHQLGQSVLEQSERKRQETEARRQQYQHEVLRGEWRRIADTPGEALRIILGNEPAFRPEPAPAAPAVATVAATPTAVREERRRAPVPVLDWIDERGAEIDEDRRTLPLEEWSHDEARYFAVTDAKTGLPNRLAYEVALKQTPQARHAKLDLDGLKRANDTYGHHVGDEFIEMLALESRRNGVRLFRVGGDEFEALYEGADQEIAPLIEATRKGVEGKKVPVEGKRAEEYPAHEGFSYGLGSDSQAADRALYEDKRRRGTGRSVRQGEALPAGRDGVGESPRVQAPPGQGRRRGNEPGGAPPAGSAPLPPPVAPPTQSAPPAPAAARSAAPEAAPAPPPNPPPSTRSFSRIGKDGEAFTADGERVGVKWAVADVFDDVVPSHSITLEENPAFAQVLQPRNRERMASEQQVERMARAIRPAELGENYHASSGAPIVGPDRLVESGNGRTIALQRAYRMGRGEEYRTWLEQHAEEFGLTPAQVREVKSPVLVRVRTTPTENRGELVKKFNVATVAGMSDAETARSDSDRLTPELLAKFQPSDEGLSITAARNRPFVADFLKTVPETEREKMLDEDGQLSKSGISRIQNALLGKAYGRSAILERLTESTDDNIKQVSTALVNAAPAMATLRGAIEGGEVLAELDPTPAIVEAAQKLAWLRDEGGTVESYLRQQGLFGDDMTPAGREALQAFDEFKRSGRKSTEFLTKLARSITLGGSAKQDSLFDDVATPGLDEFVETARRFVSDGGTGQLALEAGSSASVSPETGRPGPEGVPPGEPSGPVDRPRVSLSRESAFPATDARRVMLVERFARNLSAAWKDAPRITVVPTEEGLPDELRALAEGSRVEGVYVPREDHVYLVAGSLRSREAVERVVLHEVMGHAGLRRVLGREQYGTVMDGIARSMPDEVRAKAEEYELDLTTAEGRQEAADEVLAEWASRGEPAPRPLARAVMAIRGWLRKLFPNLKWTPEEVRTLLANARTRVERGTGKRGSGTSARLSRGRMDWLEEDLAAGRAELHGEDVALYFHKDSDGFPAVSAIRRDNGLTVGEASFVYELVPNAEETGLENGRLKGWNVEVKPEYRRRGVARAMYELASRKEGKAIVPGDVLTPDGAAFRGKGVAPRFSRAQESTPAFREWFGDSKVVDEQGKPKVVYHGTKRPDRVGSVFRRSRATSGLMAFFTTDPETASSYSTKKRDTSFEPPDDYAGWFKVKVGRSEVPVDRAWYALSWQQRETLAKNIPHVVWDNEDGADTIRLGGENEYGLAGKDHWDYTLRREARGNPLRAAVEVWLNSGGLFDQEERFVEILRAAGLQNVRFDSPWAENPGVLPVYLAIQNPLDTAAIPAEVVRDLERASVRQGPPKPYGPDQWSKNTQDPRVWIQRLRDDVQGGKSSYAWTSIPDWVTKALKRRGYDGIKDTGGKGGGPAHDVWIPFEETQVKSATGNRGTFDPTKKDIRFSRTGATGPAQGQRREKNVRRIYQALVDDVRRQSEAATQRFTGLMDELNDPADVLERRKQGAIPEHSRALDEMIARRTPEAAKFLNPAEQAYQETVRRHYALEKATRVFDPQGNLPAHKDPGIMAERIGGAAGIAEEWMFKGGPFRRTADGGIERTGTPTLEVILRPVQGKLRELDRYLLAARVVELQGRKPTQPGLFGGTKGIVTGVDPDDARAEVAAAAPEVKEAARLFYQWENDALEYWAEAGGLSPEAKQVIREMNRSYVPLYRIFEGKEAQEVAKRMGPGRAGAWQAEQSVKRITGGKDPVLSPLVAAIDHVKRMVRAGDVNLVGRTLVEAAEARALEVAEAAERRTDESDPRRIADLRDAASRAAVGHLIARVPASPSAQNVTPEGRRVAEAARGYGVEITPEAAEAISALSSKRLTTAEDSIRIWRNGKLEEYRLEKSLGKSLRALGPEDLGAAMRALQLPTDLFRGGVTKAPIFMLRNLIRDTGDASIQTTNGFIPILDTVRGFVEAVRDGKLRHEFLAGGGGYATITEGRIKGAEQILERAAAKGAGKSTLYWMRHPLEGLNMLARPFEEASRLGEFRKARLRGKSTQEASIDAARITTNFTVRGANPYVYAFIRLVPFLNPAMQGVDRMARSVFMPPRGKAVGSPEHLRQAAVVGWHGAVNLMLPTMLLYLLNRDDDEIQELRKSKAGAVFWYFRAGPKDGASVIIPVPKPFAWGQLFGSGTEALLDRFLEKDREGFDRWSRDFLESLGVKTERPWYESVLGTSPPTVQMAAGLMKNRDLFFNTPIVPRGLEEVEPRYQAGRFTGSTARRVGDLLNWSPAKLEYAARQTFGTLGREALRASDKLLAEEEPGVSAPAGKPSDLPLIGSAFARTPSTRTHSIEKLYEARERAQGRVATLRELQKTHPERVAAYREKHAHELRIAKRLADRTDQIGDLRKRMERLRKRRDAEMSPAEKTQRLDELTRRMTEIARSALASTKKREPER